MSRLTLSGEGKKFEMAAKVDYQFFVNKNDTDLVVLAQFNEPGNYEVYGDIRKPSMEGLKPSEQKKIQAGIDQAIDLLVNPTIVQPITMPPPPSPIYFQQPQMMQPPAPPRIAFPPQFQQPPPRICFPPQFQQPPPRNVFPPQFQQPPSRIFFPPQFQQPRPRIFFPPQFPQQPPKFFYSPPYQ